ncbi:hypothetical protein HN51_059725, partial [Arachis hypogaea]
GRVVEIYGPEASGKTTLALHVISEAQKQGVGKLPASQANPEVVSAFRREEKEQAMRLLDNYLRICRAAKVKASFMMTEADQVQKGIVALVVGHNIRRLVIGAIPEGGKHIWTREASEKPCSLSPCETIETEGTFAAESTTSSGPLPQNSAESSSDTHLEAEEERVNSQLVEVKQEADEAADESFVELLKLEAEATEAIRKVNLFESAHAQEVKLRQEAEDELRTTDCGEQALSLVDTLIRSSSVDVIVVGSVSLMQTRTSSQFPNMPKDSFWRKPVILSGIFRSTLMLL